jgi:predicted nucleotidyltransferase
MNKKWNKFLLEAIQDEEIELPSIGIRDTLNMNVWQSEDRIKPEITGRLIQIALDFLESLGLDHEVIKDITLTGSLANYNWTEFSDIDLHIIAEFRYVDDNTGLVRDFFNAKKADWNKTHQIMIKNHEVEIYVQDVREAHISTGVYSLLEDVWLTKPSREVPKIDYESVKIKAKSIMDQIDRVEDLYLKNNFEASQNIADIIRSKIKRLRRCGLAEKGIYSTENIVFKTLRNNGYIEKILTLKTDSYDKLMSLNHNAI